MPGPLQQTVTLAELLTEHSPGWEPPPPARRALIQTRCHQHAVTGFDAVRESAPDDVVLADGFSCRTQIEQGNAAGR
ncbi:hypothetical protein [Arthrobacter sp. A5]|uniref:hypothetical protein n=1 Tax=Arthrobacter sp. A5 TaxID=576926 RepID=UPI003DA80FEF